MSQAMLRERLKTPEASLKLRQIRENMSQIASKTEGIVNSISSDDDAGSFSADVLEFPPSVVRRRSTVSSRTR
jgi:hypothetical protein